MVCADRLWFAQHNVHERVENRDSIRRLGIRQHCQGIENILFRRFIIFLTMLSILALPIGIVFSLVAGILTFYLAAPFINHLWTLTTLSIIILLTVSSGIGWPISKRLLHHYRPHFTGVYAVSILTIAILLVGKFLPKPKVSYQAPEASPGMEFWSLPTGSNLAYVHIPTIGSSREAPIIFLHGGPGFLVLESDVKFYGQLAQDGFDVYLYDQVGSGRSNRLEDVRDYTTQRHVADLEAVRQQIGAEKVILIGQSWGNTLLADYMAAYPEHVAKAIFSSPGAIWDVGRFKPSYSGTADSPIDAPPPPWRVPLAVVFIPRNILIAEQLLSERELEAYFNTQPSVSNQNYCKGDEAKVPVLDVRGANQYVNRLTFASQETYPDPRPALRQNQTPALIMRGECEFMPREVAYEYKETLPNATFVSVPNAGHALYGAQPEFILSTIRAFLLDQALPQFPNNEENQE